MSSFLDKVGFVFWKDLNIICTGTRESVREREERERERWRNYMECQFSKFLSISKQTPNTITSTESLPYRVPYLKSTKILWKWASLSWGKISNYVMTAVWPDLAICFTLGNSADSPSVQIFSFSFLWTKPNNFHNEKWYLENYVQKMNN